jgi:hypothetical protein
VTDGLAEGDAVVATPATLEPGARIRVAAASAGGTAPALAPR